MLGRIFTIALAISAVAFGSCCIISYLRPSYFGRVWDQGALVCKVNPGSMYVWYVHNKDQRTVEPPIKSRISLFFVGLGRSGYDRWFRVRFVGGVQYRLQPNGYRELYAHIRFFRAAIVSLTLPILAILAGRLRLRVRRRAGRCLSCGYDMTGNQSGDCPECGAGRPVVTSGR